MSRFDDLREIGPLPIWEGIVARNVAGERMNMAIVELEPGGVPREATGGPDGCVVMDAFAPARHEWDRSQHENPRPAVRPR